MVHVFHSAVMFVCLALLGAMACGVLVCLLAKSGRAAKRTLSAGQFAAFVFAAIVCTYAAQKSGTIRVESPYPGTPYLIDAGSYLDPTNDLVHVNFTRHPALPNDAALIIDFKPVGETNNVWMQYLETTVGNELWQPPFSFPFENCTNYNWVVYTTWTSGPAVITNGVWHTNWAFATNRIHIIPLKTEIIYEGKNIMPATIEEEDE